MHPAQRTRSRLPHWLVIWTILLAALVPAVAPWMARAQVRYALPSAEMCSAARHAAPMPHQKGSDHVTQGKHCALCVHEVTSTGLPPPPQTVALRLDLGLTPAHGHEAHGATPVTWSRPHTRAPPVSLG